LQRRDGDFTTSGFTARKKPSKSGPVEAPTFKSLDLRVQVQALGMQGLSAWRFFCWGRS
jgi:hypothetical protein